jgi:CubicO group peptidase (beta-lactamase class C family)
MLNRMQAKLWPAITLLVVSLTLGAHAQSSLSPEVRTNIDAAAAKVLARTGVPSAVVGIVRNGQIAYTAGYGSARLAPLLKASPEMLYPIGSISKQFTAACVLLLVEDGKMSLDDPVARWFPELTESRNITVRMLLSHTSGYSDFAPQDYTIPAWTHPTDTSKLIHEWAEKPLDFAPGTRWQYSNTNYGLLSLIVEKVSGEPFWQFITRRVLQPVGILNAITTEGDRSRIQPSGYMRNALGPPRPAILEAKGWYNGGGELAMPVADLLRWDIAVQTLETTVHLKDGTNTGYALGMDVRTQGGQPVLSHSGEVGGFVAINTVYPDEKLAIAVLTNQEASSAASGIAEALAPLLLPPGAAATVKIATAAKIAEAPVGTVETQTRQILTALQHGRIDRRLFTADCNFYFSAETIADFATSLTPLGPITELKQTTMELRGGMTFRIFSVKFGQKTVGLTTYTMPDGKLEQFLIEP